MKITDLNGHEIEVVNLSEAITQAEIFKNYRHADKAYSLLDEQLTAYWTDLHRKLLELKEQKQ